MVLVFAVLILGVVYGLKNFLTTQGLLTESITIKEITLEVNEDIEKMKYIEDEHHDHSDLENSEEEMSGSELEILNKNKEPEYVIKLLFGAVKLQDIDLFTSVFEFEQLNKALFSVVEPDKEKVLREMVSRISRNNSIKEINILSLKQEEDVSVSAEVKISFEGDIHKNVSLVLVPASTFHESDNGIFVVVTSPWDVINQIEGK